jgi:hypothetical protein
MGTLPPDVSAIIGVFAALFSRRLWPRAPVLLMGAILTVGRRTVAAVLGVMGLQRRAAVQELSSGAESGALVGAGDKSSAAGTVGQDLCTARAISDGVGRYD